MLVIFFGVVTLGTAFIKTYGQLIATRVLLGVFEAGTLVSMSSPFKWLSNRSHQLPIQSLAILGIFTFSRM